MLSCKITLMEKVSCLIVCRYPFLLFSACTCVSKTWDFLCDLWILIMYYYAAHRGVWTRGESAQCWLENKFLAEPAIQTHANSDKLISRPAPLHVALVLEMQMSLGGSVAQLVVRWLCNQFLAIDSGFRPSEGFFRIFKIQRSVQILSEQHYAIRLCANACKKTDVHFKILSFQGKSRHLETDT